LPEVFGISRIAETGKIENPAFYARAMQLGVDKSDMSKITEISCPKTAELWQKQGKNRPKNAVFGHF
jgi:hypothetical protein